jgi:hypothetical protein
MAAEAQVFGLIHSAHASATDFPDDAIVGDRLADHEGPVGVMLGRWRRQVNGWRGGGKETGLERPPLAIGDETLNKVPLDPSHAGDDNRSLFGVSASHPLAVLS